jgi:hypothetical protein
MFITSIWPFMAWLVGGEKWGFLASPSVILAYALRTVEGPLPLDNPRWTKYTFDGLQFALLTASAIYTLKGCFNLHHILSWTIFAWSKFLPGGFAIYIVVRGL